MKRATLVGAGSLALIGAVTAVFALAPEWRSIGPVTYATTADNFLAIGPTTAIAWDRVEDPELQRVLACNLTPCAYEPVPDHGITRWQWVNGDITQAQALERLKTPYEPSRVWQVTVAPHSPDILLIETDAHGWSTVHRSRWDKVTEVQR